MHETDSGDLLTIDQLQPVGKGGDDSLENLVYSCIRQAELIKEQRALLAEQRTLLQRLFERSGM